MKALFCLDDILKQASRGVVGPKLAGSWICDHDSGSREFQRRQPLVALPLHSLPGLDPVDRDSQDASYRFGLPDLDRAEVMLRIARGKVQVAEYPPSVHHRHLDHVPDAMHAVGTAVGRGFLPLLRRHHVQVVGGAAGGEGLGENRVDIPRLPFVPRHKSIADVRRRNAPWAISRRIDEVVPVYRNPHHPTEASEEAALELLETRR